MMLTNLFSIFDPSTSINNSMNWMTMIMWIIFMSYSMYMSSGRLSKLMKNFLKTLYKDLINQMKKNPPLLIFSFALMMLIMLNNLSALLPFVFAPTSHMIFTFTLSMTCWLAIMSFSSMFNINKMLTHLIPIGTPLLLTPFMVLIETISIMIRPITLAVRLAANMIAGHLLITLLMSTTPLTPLLLLMPLWTAQMILTTLELAVALIQSYVFSILTTMYISESI